MKAIFRIITFFESLHKALVLPRQTIWVVRDKPLNLAEVSHGRDLQDSNLNKRHYVG